MALTKSTGWIVGLLFLTSIASADGPLPSEPHVYVKGSASVDFTPDRLTLSIRYDHTDQDVAVAKASVDTRSRMFLKVCSELGIKKKNIQASELNISPDTEFRDGKRHLIGTRVGRRVTVVLESLASYSELMSGLLKTSPDSIGSSNLSSTRNAEKINEAQLLALADARGRAKRLADAMGVKLGGVHSISEFDLREEESWSLSPARYVSRGDGTRLAPSISQPPPPPGEEVFEPGTITAKAEVFVVFLLE